MTQIAQCLPPTTFRVSTTGRPEPYYRCFGCNLDVREYDDRGLVTLTGKHFCTPCRERRRQVTEAIRPMIEPRYATAQLTDWPGRVSDCYAWPDKTPMILVCGLSNSGKTRLCWAVIKHAGSKGFAVKYLFLPTAREQWAASNEGRESLFAAWTETANLILDDLSGCNASDGWKEALHRLIEIRMVAQKPTIITTAAGSAELIKQYDAALVRRLVDIGHSGLVKLPERKQRTAGW